MTATRETTETRSRQRRRELRPGWQGLLLAVGLAVQLAPLVLLPLVLTQDGPAHVDGAWVLLHHADAGAVGDALSAAYEVDLSLVPNMLTTVLLTGLLTVVGPGVAEKAVVVGFVVLLVTGLRFALRGVDVRSGWLAAAALPLAGGQLVAYGFYNFCWGVALALFVIGVGLRRRSGWGAGPTVLAAVLLALMWSAHLLPWVVAVSVLGGLALGRWAAAVRAGLRPGQAAVRHVLPPLVAVLPGAVASLAYVLRGGADHGAAAGGLDAERGLWLLTLYRPLVVGSRWEVAPALLVAVALWSLLLLAVRRPREDPDDLRAPAAPGTATPRSDRAVLGVAALVSVAAVLVVPSRLGSEYGFLPERLAWFPPLLVVLFVATRPPRSVAVQRAVAGALVLAATAATAVRMPTLLADQRTAGELLSIADVIPAGATFAVLRFSGHEAALAPLRGEPDPLRHLSSRLAVEVGGVDVGHYEAVYPYFQVRFRPDGVRQAIDPGLDGLDAVPPWVHLPAAGDRLQYVLVVGLDRAEGWVRSAHRTAGVLADLRARYVPVAESGPSGYVSVWRLQDSVDG